MYGIKTVDWCFPFLDIIADFIDITLSNMQCLLIDEVDYCIALGIEVPSVFPQILGRCNGKSKKPTIEIPHKQYEVTSDLQDRGFNNTMVKNKTGVPYRMQKDITSNPSK